MNRLLSTIKRKLNSNKKKYIYGAGDVAREVLFCLTQEPYCISIDAFIVTKTQNTETQEIEDIPVTSVYNESIDKDALIIIAVLEKYRDEICQILDDMGMTDRIFMTFESDIYSEFREESFSHYCKLKRYPFLFSMGESHDKEVWHLGNQEDFYVYVTRSSRDKELKAAYTIKLWEKEIFAGVAIDNAGRFNISDDKSDNISLKNRQYCELTVMYWIWKNTDSEYIGLSHYRRRFDFEDDDIALIKGKDIDCVLTIPMINVPDVRYMYGKNHEVEDWDIMADIVKEMNPDYSQALRVVGESNYYVPYNMFVMKRKVFNDYCAWLYPILEKCEETIGQKNDPYQNRYIGFLAERLMTAYIYHHREDLKILFWNKHFLE